MRNSDATRAKLIAAAKEAFWNQGYSNTSLRAIARAASVDVALISRYFSGKLGLFEATLESAFEWPELLDKGQDPIEVAIRKFAHPDTESHAISTAQLILMNANDPQAGELVRKALRQALIDPLQARMGDPQASARLAMLVTVILGASMVRHSLHLPGMADVEPDVYERQLRHLINAAMSFDQEPRV
ncbi:TetR/AcrR family transcriptional regulator [Hoeflea ulvae]|uniref:TetR family transcriptional regulator n=1 Tax=Hoeflea ulvae TaxID=2983764 RepID=A0ABT3YHV2_9HYPH|nr:TetR/AcrR family transcriptional regulator [Hoeflea ulvae]MCY0095483.1 TetR family transcriptional regulator [Hoeflea ulvae]